MRSRLWAVTLSIGIALVVAGCGDDSSGPSSEGSFEGTLTGDRTGTKSGFAILENTPTSFSIYGGTRDDEFDFDINAGPAGLPTVGTHQIGYGADEFYSSVFVNDFEFEYVAISGSVTIASATAALVRGTLNVTYENAGETFTFAGSFSAKPCGATCPE